MSRSKKSVKDLDWDDDDDFASVERDKERRKNKRLANALRSKNITDLLRLEEDEDT